MKKITAFLMVFVIILSFTACDALIPSTPESLREQLTAADAALESKGYTASVSTAYSSTDPDMLTALTTVKSSAAKVEYNGQDAKVETNVSVGDVTVSSVYTVWTGTLYNKVTATTSSGTTESLRCAEIANDSFKEFLVSLGAGTKLTHDDFDNIAKENGVIVCSGLKALSEESVSEIIAGKFDKETEITVTDAKLSFKLKNGKYTEETLVCTFSVAGGASSESTELTVKMTKTYDYSKIVMILPPDGRDNYTKVDYSDIIG